MNNQTPGPRVAIIVLNWNGLEDSLECLESLRAVTYPNYEVIMVDNASDGDDVKVFREKYGDYLHIIENRDNYGYGKGYTIGVNEAFIRGAKYALLLHNDTVVAPDFLDVLVRVAEEHPEYGILSPVNFSYDQPDKVQHGGERARWFGLRGMEVANLKEDEKDVLECTWVPLACLLMERDKVSRMGLLSAMQDYFLYGDPIWHLCSMTAKLKIGCVPQARIWHKSSQSLQRAGWSRMKWIIRDNLILRYRFLSPKNLKRLTLSQFIFFTTWLFIYRPPDFIKLLLRSFRGNMKLKNN